MIRSVVFLMSVCSVALFSCNKKEVTEVLSMNSKKDSVSHVLGVVFGRNAKGQLAQSGVEIDSLNKAQLIEGFTQVLEGKDSSMTDEEMNGLIRDYIQATQERKVGKNKEAGKAFLAENKKKEGVVELPSGLQYKVLKEGTGKKPSGPTANVTVHYHGTTIDGKVFDSSVERGQPASFALNGVIAGWTEGVQLMKEGAKYEFYIPSELAYGDRQQGPDIGPGSVLIFEVELLEVKGE